MFPTGFLIFLVRAGPKMLLSDKNSRQQTTQDTSDIVTHVQRTPVSSSMAHTKEKESFIQKVFYEISLEKDPALWQDDTDTVDKNVERIR